MCKQSQIWEPLHRREQVLQPVRRPWHTASFTTQVRSINADWKIRCFQCYQLHTNQHPATLINQLMPSVLAGSSSTIIPVDTTSSAWVKTHFGRGRTVATLLWKSSLCPAVWWAAHMPHGQMVRDSLAVPMWANRVAPGHSTPQCSTSACPQMGMLPACTAWAWAQAERDQLCQQCLHPAHSEKEPQMGTHK